MNIQLKFEHAKPRFLRHVCIILVKTLWKIYTKSMLKNVWKIDAKMIPKSMTIDPKMKQNASESCSGLRFWAFLNDAKKHDFLKHSKTAQEREKLAQGAPKRRPTGQETRPGVPLLAAWAPGAASRATDTRYRSMKQATRNKIQKQVAWIMKPQETRNKQTREKRLYQHVCGPVARRILLCRFPKMSDDLNQQRF